MGKKDRGAIWGKLKGSWRGWHASEAKGDVKGMKSAREGIKTNAEKLGLKPYLPRITKKK